MTILLKKCTAFACDRTVSELRWALGYRTCSRHAAEGESLDGTDRWRGRSQGAERPWEMESWHIAPDRVRLARMIATAERARGSA